MGSRGYLRTMPHVLLAGAPTGCWTNLGDEAILVGMVTSLRRVVADVEITVVSSSPDGFLERHGCAAVRYDDLDGVIRAVAGSDLVVLGGGSIFFDYWAIDAADVLTPRHQGLSLWTGLALLAAADDIPVAVYGVGVGPLATPDGELLTAAAFEAASAVTLRDNDSIDTLARLGLGHLGAVVTGDPALGVDLAAAAPHRSGLSELPELSALPRPLLGVAVREWDIGVDPEAWQSALAQALDHTLERDGGTVVFVPCHRSVAWPLTDDTGAASAVRARMAQPERCVVVDIDLTWAERAAVLAGCDHALAMRYHAALFTQRAGVPTVGLSYDPKVAGLFREWDEPDLVVDIGEATAAGLIARLDRVHDDLSLVPALHDLGSDLTEQEARTIEIVAGLLGRPASPPGGPALERLLARLSLHPADRPPAAAEALDRLAAKLGVEVEATSPSPEGAPVPPTVRGRVAVLTNQLLDRESGAPMVGGAERYGLELGHLLRDLGLDPTFFQGGGTWEVGDYFGFPVVALPFGGAFSEYEFGVAEAFFEATADFDHVLYLMPNYASGPMRPDAVVVSHGVWWDHALWPLLSFRTPEWYEHLERVYGRAERVVSVDFNTINVVRALFPEVADRIVPVPSGVDTELFHPPATRRVDNPLVIFPRRVEVTRGPSLVGAILDLVPDACRFAWVGTGDPGYEKVFAELAQRDPRFTQRSAGFDEMPAVYRGADICVIPTIGSEGRSLACLEAMASGCAVVVTHVGGLPELVTDEVDALVCEPTAASIAAAVRRLVRDPELRRRLGAAARISAERQSLLLWRSRWAQTLVELGWVDDAAAAVPYDVIHLSAPDASLDGRTADELVAWERRGRRVFRLEAGDRVDDTRLAELRDREGIDRAVVLVASPAWASAALSAREAFGWPVLCLGDHDGSPAGGLAPGEETLIEDADLVVASTRADQERWFAARPDVLLARTGPDPQDGSSRPGGASWWDDRVEVVERALVTLLAPRTTSSPGTEQAGTEPAGTGSTGTEVHWTDDPVVPSSGAASPEELDALRNELDALHRSRALKVVNLYWRGRQAFDRRFLHRSHD